MSYVDAIILGTIQGLTEFLPISSSGHLVLAQELLGVKQPGVSFEVLLHMGTLLSVIVYFRSNIVALVQSLFVKEMRNERFLLACLILGTVPAALMGLLLDDTVKQAFTSPLLVAVLLLVTGLILLIPRFVAPGKGDISWRSALMMGLGQALAIFPGISRSGSTIVAGMLSGVKASRAAEFSFLLVLPVIAGATLLEVGELARLESTLLGQYLVGTLVSFLFGLMAVYLVLSSIRRGRFEYFAYYCFAAGLTGLYLFS